MLLATDTTKHFVDLWERETVLRRKRIVVEAPSDWDAERLKRLNGEELNRLICEAGCVAESEIEDVDDFEVLSYVDISGWVPDRLAADISFVQDECGDLFAAKSGKPAPFLD